MLNLEFYDSEDLNGEWLVAKLEFAQHVHIVPRGPKALALAQEIFAHRPDLLLTTASDAGPPPAPPFCLGDPGDADAIVLLYNSADAEAIADALLGEVERKAGLVLAPKSSGYFEARPLYVVSVPKAGTHLLFELVHAFGYSSGELNGDRPKEGHWHCLEYSNTHTRAPDFFIDSVRRAPYGNRQHPFARTPTVFMYRNPLDILVSEANYYPKSGRTIYSNYFDGLEFNERIKCLISDPWLLGSFRDRMAAFVPWFRFSNVLPVSFEELVGEQGGVVEAFK